MSAEARPRGLDKMQAAGRAQAVPRSARKRDEAVDRGGTEVCKAVHVERRKLRREIVNDQPRPGLRARLGKMV